MASAVDWKKLKLEYVTTNISYRKLADKYGVPKTTIDHQAKKGKWSEERRRFRANVETKTIKAVEDKAVDYRSALYDLAYKVAMQLVDMTDCKSLADLAVIGITPRQITGAIKDLKDVLDIKSEADIKEQDARIKNLQRQANAADDGAKAIEITVKGYDDEWSN